MPGSLGEDLEWTLERVPVKQCKQFPMEGYESCSCQKSRGDALLPCTFYARLSSPIPNRKPQHTRRTIRKSLYVVPLLPANLTWLHPTRRVLCGSLGRALCQHGTTYLADRFRAGVGRRYAHDRCPSAASKSTQTFVWYAQQSVWRRHPRLYRF